MKTPEQLLNELNELKKNYSNLEKEIELKKKEIRVVEFEKNIQKIKKIINDEYPELNNEKYFEHTIDENYNYANSEFAYIINFKYTTVKKFGQYLTPKIELKKSFSTSRIREELDEFVEMIKNAYRNKYNKNHNVFEYEITSLKKQLKEIEQEHENYLKAVKEIWGDEK